MACQDCDNVKDYLLSLNGGPGKVLGLNSLGEPEYVNPISLFGGDTYQNGLTRISTTVVEFGGANPLIHDTTLNMSSYFFSMYGNRGLRIGLSASVLLPPGKILADYDNTAKLVLFNPLKTDLSGSFASAFHIENQDPNTTNHFYTSVDDIVGQLAQKRVGINVNVSAVYGSGAKLTIHPNCPSIQGNFLINLDGRGGYGLTTTIARDNSLTTRSTLDHSALAKIDVYGNHVGQKWWFHRDTDFDTTPDPDYFGKVGSSRHQEGLLLFNDAEKDVALLKFMNRAKVTNTVAPTNENNGNEGVFHFFNNGAGTTVDTFRITSGSDQVSGATLSLVNYSVLLNNFHLAKFENIYTGLESRVFLIRSNSKVVVNALQYPSDLSQDMVTGSNQPYSYHHTQGMISGPSFTQTAPVYQINNDTFFLEADTANGDKTFNLPDPDSMHCCPIIEIVPNSATNRIILTCTSKPNSLTAYGVSNNSYLVPTGGVGVAVRQVGGRWTVWDLHFGGTFVP